jgi:hypothetical protein
MGQLPSGDVLFKVAKELDISGPHTVNRTCDGSFATAGSVWTALPAVPISRPVISISLDAYVVLSARTHAHARARGQESVGHVGVTVEEKIAKPRS